MRKTSRAQALWFYAFSNFTNLPLPYSPYPVLSTSIYLWSSFLFAIPKKTLTQSSLLLYSVIHVFLFPSFLPFSLSLSLSLSFAASVAYGRSQARGWKGAAAGTYTTAMTILDLSCICDLLGSVRQYWILNPLSEARDPHRDSIWSLTHRSTMGTPIFFLSFCQTLEKREELVQTLGDVLITRRNYIHFSSFISVSAPSLSPPPPPSANS